MVADDEPSSRRRFLQVVGATRGSAALAGCTGVGRAVRNRTGPHRYWRDAPIDGQPLEPWPTVAATATRRNARPTETGPRPEMTGRYIAPQGDRTPIQPIVADGTVYAAVVPPLADDFEGVIATDLEGQERWRMAGELPGIVGVISITGGTALLPVGPGIVAVDRRTGEPFWRYRNGGNPTVVGSTVYIADNGLRALDARTGEPRWHVDTHPVGELAADESLVVSTAHGAEDVGTVAINDGTVQWTSPLGGGTAHPVLGDEQAYVAGDDGTIAALSRATGETSWTTTLRPESDVTPALADEHGLVYATDQNSARIHAFDVHSGEQQWSYDCGTGIAFSPVVAGDTLYALAQEDPGFVSALDPIDGTERWHRSVPRRPTTDPVVGEGMLVFGSFPFKYAGDTPPQHGVYAFG